MTGLREMVLLKETALKSDTVNEVTKMEEEDVPELVEIKDTKNNDSDGYFTSYDDVQVSVETKIFEGFGEALFEEFIMGREPVSIVYYTRPGTCINHPLH